MTIISKDVDLNNLPRMSAKDLARLDAITDDEIDFSDIPELDDNFWKNAKIIEPSETQSVGAQIIAGAKQALAFAEGAEDHNCVIHAPKKTEL